MCACVKTNVICVKLPVYNIVVSLLNSPGRHWACSCHQCLVYALCLLCLLPTACMHAYPWYVCVSNLRPRRHNTTPYICPQAMRVCVWKWMINARCTLVYAYMCTTSVLFQFFVSHHWIVLWSGSLYVDGVFKTDRIENNIYNLEIF